MVLIINVAVRQRRLMVKPPKYCLHGQMPGAFMKTYALYALVFGSVHGGETQKCHIPPRMDQKTGALCD